MGGGTYCSTTRSTRAEAKGYTTKSAQEIFTQRNINNAMNPYGINLRESRDSQEHPNSLPIIIALDVTGSMGSIPHYLVKEGLPNMMDKIIKAGIPDPQILFLAIGDHTCDQAPLQVGQFESSDELLDKWLTDVWLEGKGGGNEGESYLLAWFFAGRYTSTDSWEKRKHKGYLFTIGDEPTLDQIRERDQKTIMGDGQYSDCSASELLEKAMETYHCYHLHIKQTSSGSRESVMKGWRELMSDNLTIVERKESVGDMIADLVVKGESQQQEQQTTQNKPANQITKMEPEEIIL